MTSGLYESFNARNYSPSEVARSFIPNADYFRLWNNQHTIVLGPRGSGKTTLFKMLTIPAIYSWQSSFSIECRRKRPFTAIYIPTDMHWHHQLCQTDKELECIPRFKHIASEAAVTTSILLAVAHTFAERLKYEAQLGDNKEAEFCAHLIKEWQLPHMLPSLDNIQNALKSRMSEIRQIIKRTIREQQQEHVVLRGLPNYFDLEYFPAIDVACNRFDTDYRLPQSDKWALCFDELEIAPLWLQKTALSQQRGVADNYLIKVSTSPIPQVLGETEARPRQDLCVISIWNHADNDYEDFSENLTRSILKRRFGASIQPSNVFGKTGLVDQENECRTKYETNSSEWRLFKDLASFDKSFRQALINARIDPANPVATDTAIRDSFLRKAKPIALLRASCLRPTNTGTLGMRSRKNYPIYAGREAIYRVCDGNPRRLIGVMNDLISKMSCDRKGNVKPLAHSVQADVLDRASRQFYGYIQSVAGSTAVFADTTLDLASIVKCVSTYIRKRILGPNFELDPAGSFTVDSNLNERLIELLRVGVYHGAFVHVDPIPDSVETSLRKKRFRLSYMLSPSNRLPLQLHESVFLSGMLRATEKPRIRKIIDHLVQQQQELVLQ